MNLTSQGVYQKATRSSRTPTKAEQEHMDAVRALGCIICYGPASIHHCDTGQGGRKDHMKALPLCHWHHQGEEGIHTLGRKRWSARFGTEQELMIKVRGML
jgi:hypothetical protein